MKCSKCGYWAIDTGRAFDGRRAYRCINCDTVWTNGMQGRKRRYSQQRPGYQFKDTGAAKAKEGRG